jgi:hypothetical protein
VGERRRALFDGSCTPENALGGRISLVCDAADVSVTLQQLGLPEDRGWVDVPRAGAYLPRTKDGDVPPDEVPRDTP